MKLMNTKLISLQGSMGQFLRNCILVIHCFRRFTDLHHLSVSNRVMSLQSIAVKKLEINQQLCDSKKIPAFINTEVILLVE